MRIALVPEGIERIGALVFVIAVLFPDVALLIGLHTFQVVILT